MYRKLLILLELFILSFFSCNTSKTPEKSNDSESVKTNIGQPNIIFYLADDQDVYDYGCYGNEKVNTSAVDRLAKEGMLFTNAFSAQAICAPSRSQLFTGNYPLKNGCFANHTSTKPNIKSVTTHLKKLGYEVVLAGKSHVKPSNVYQWNKEWEPVPKANMPRAYLPLDSIEAYFKNTKKPFCMFITSKYPHGKYFDVDNAKVEDIKFFPFNASKKTDKAFVKKKAGYYRSIAEDNTQIEKVLDYVDEHLDDNTLFIYSADHGVSGKFTVKDIGLKVPFVVRWPKVIKPNSTSNQLIHYTDVLPTFIDVAGGKSIEDIDGKSFLSLLKGENIEVNQYVYGVRTNQNILNSEVFPSRMIRNQRYKYIRNFNSFEIVKQNLTGKPNVDYFLNRGANAFKNEPFEEVYDLQNDPFEQHNLAEDIEFKQIKDTLQKALFVWMKAQDDFLNEEKGNMPLITAKGKRGFKLDQNTPRRKIPDSIKNTLSKEDYKIIKHW